MTTSTEAEFTADTELNVAQLLKANVGASRKIHLSVSSLPLGEDRQARDLDGIIKLIRLNHGLLATGSVHATAELTCVRCLNDYTQPLEITLEEEFRPSIDMTSGASIAYKGADADGDFFLIGDDHVLDLAEPLRQAVWLAAPMMPRCREDCPGIPVAADDGVAVAPAGPVPTAEGGVDARLAILGDLLAATADDESSGGLPPGSTGRRRPRR